jgi:hypothetical protein
MIKDNYALGYAGEKLVRFQLEHVLRGWGVHLTGPADDGIDIVVQFRSTCSTPQPIIVGIQVKTGDSYAASVGSRWQMRPLDPTRFKQWQEATIPVALVWVKPEAVSNAYWAMVKEEAPHDKFLISKRSLISPATPYDLSLKLWRGNRRRVPEHISKLLCPPLGLSARNYARDYYRTKMMTEQPLHPVLGTVKFTWKGWRHITRNSRRARDVYQSIHLLPAVRRLVDNPGALHGIRPLSLTTRGPVTTRIQLIAYKARSVLLAGRAPGELVAVYRERINYPSNWHNDLELAKKVKREITFESVYEVAPKKK